MPRDEYAAVSEKNDWGSITTFIGKERMAPSKTRARIEVMFPDGTLATVPMLWKAHAEHVNDMGHEYQVASSIPYIELTVHGSKIEVRLAHSGLRAKPPQKVQNA